MIARRCRPSSWPRSWPRGCPPRAPAPAARRRRTSDERRVLVPFSGALDRTVLDAAIRIARADEAVLVPAYLLVVPLQYAEDSARKEQVAVALPLLEAVEQAALRARVPVDARIEKGRSLDPRAAAAVGRRAVRPHRRPGAGVHGEGARVDPHARARSRRSCSGPAPEAQAA